MERAPVPRSILIHKQPVRTYFTKQFARGNVFIIYVVVQFYPWFNFNFLLFQAHCHTLPFPKTKQEKQKQKQKKLNQGGDEL